MNKRPSLIGGCLFIFFIGGCVAIAVIISAIIGVQDRAYQLFGEPANYLSDQQRIYLSLQLILQTQDLSMPLDTSGVPMPFKVQEGETTASVIQRLESAGLVRNAGALRAYLVYRGLDTTIQAGEYELNPAMTAVEIAYALQDATPTIVKFRILPGWRMEEIAQALPTSGLNITQNEFLIASQSNPSSVLTYKFPAHATMEGFLYPDTYQLRRDVSINEFMMSILSNFEQKLSPDIQQGFLRQGLDVYSGVTLASIVQREAVIDEEMPLIASVFLNRLAAGIKLDSDPTVQYAVGYNHQQNTWWTNPLSMLDLQVDSPYNTYLYPELPPGPISNPGITALSAVAFPAQSPYYYFRSACDGSGRHTFAETFQQHVANECP